MARYNKRLYVEREVDGELVELELEVECEVEPFVPGRLGDIPERCYPEEGGFAIIDGPIYLINEDRKRVLWDGVLTKKEADDVEESAYIEWCESVVEHEPECDDCGNDDYYIDNDYDYFHDERAIHTANGGKVYY